MTADVAASVRARLLNQAKARGENPQPATRWQHYLAAGAVITPPPREFAEVGERVRQFLVPVYGQLGVDGVLTQRWKKGGPWTAPSTTTE